MSIELEVEEKFLRALFGQFEIPQEYPGSYYNNYLRAAFDQATAMGLDYTLRLKHCCTVLSKVVNDNQAEKIRQALTSAESVILLKQ